MKRHQCRHVRHGHQAKTTAHHRAIIGATKAEDLDDFFELCALCSAVLAGFTMFAVHEDAVEAKAALFEALRGVQN